MSPLPSARPAAALVTIVSANYLPAARVLCRSFAEHHPGARRFVAVVDRPVAASVRHDEPFEVIDVADVGIPDLDDFLAQYTILEANTAVKPFVLEHVFERYGIEHLVYLDPDIWLHAPLDAVFSALSRASVVLTPHLRDPFRDDAKPREIDILRSGTYNLGFIALRRGETASRLLEWWKEKTEHDCVVDFDNGLFVDQKWMDLVPGYFEETEILRHPGYNVAYWNLHERDVTVGREGRYLVDGEPLAFFHFSGFDAGHPARLSKHQDRHDLRGMPAVSRLFREYADRLFAEGFERDRRIPYGFAKLSNGIPVSELVRKVVRRCRKERIPFPSARDADALCRFLMTPNSEVTGRDLSPFSSVVLEMRRDVGAVYPRARDDAEDPGFLHWLRNSAHEVDSRELFERFGDSLVRVNAFVRIHRVFARRGDLHSEFPDAFRTLDGLEPFVNWLSRHGSREEDLDPGDIAAFADGGRHGFTKVLEYYLSDPQLAYEFPLGLLPWANSDFFDWALKHGMRAAGISATELFWFQHRAQTMQPAELLLLSALRGAFVRMQWPLGMTVPGWADLCEMARAAARSRGFPSPHFPEEPPDHIPSLVQIETLESAAPNGFTTPDAFRTRAAARELADTVLRPLNNRLTVEGRRRLFAPLANFTPARGVNVAGHFHYAAGAGVAAHALVRALDAAGITHQDVTLPVSPSRLSDLESSSGRVPERFWTTHRPDFDVSVTVANADVMAAARAFLGPCWDRGRTHIAHWVWETDRLPGRYADAARGLSAVWTPSEFSARGLRATLGDSVPVEVVPYAVPVRTASDPRPLPVELPEDCTVFGFFFDARSVLERKNPKAILRAFRDAFRKDDRVALVLKVNHGWAAPKEMAELERLSEGLPVLWLRDVRLDEFQKSALLSRLDAYVSLHRSEGFGLVLAEAMALGKPVIATRYSGNLEYMSDSTSVLVGAREIVTDRTHGPYPRGTRWAEPDREASAHALRMLHRDAELRGELGAQARARVHALLSPRVIGNRIDELLGWSGAPARPSPSPDLETAQFRDEAAEKALRGVPRSRHDGDGVEAVPERPRPYPPRPWPAE